jgi:hypothetical protein
MSARRAITARTPRANRPIRATLRGSRGRRGARSHPALRSLAGGSVSGWKTRFGLRNSMALAVYPVSGLLLQGENSRDQIHRRIPWMENDDDLPHDELNLVQDARATAGPTATTTASRAPSIRQRNARIPRRSSSARSRSPRSG